MTKKPYEMPAVIQSVINGSGEPLFPTGGPEPCADSRCNHFGCHLLRGGTLVVETGVRAPTGHGRSDATASENGHGSNADAPPPVGPDVPALGGALDPEQPAGGTSEFVHWRVAATVVQRTLAGESFESIVADYPRCRASFVEDVVEAVLEDRAVMAVHGEEMMDDEADKRASRTPWNP